MAISWQFQPLMKWRTRMTAVAWVVVRNTRAAEDIFQNIALRVRA